MVFYNIMQINKQNRGCNVSTTKTAYLGTAPNCFEHLDWLMCQWPQPDTIYFVIGWSQLSLSSSSWQLNSSKPWLAIGGNNQRGWRRRVCLRSELQVAGAWRAMSLSSAILPPIQQNDNEFNNINWFADGASATQWAKFSGSLAPKCHSSANVVIGLNGALPRFLSLQSLWHMAHWDELARIYAIPYESQCFPFNGHSLDHATKKLIELRHPICELRGPGLQDRQFVVRNAPSPSERFAHIFPYRHCYLSKCDR